MKKIEKNIIIASFLVQTNKDSISIREILEYSKEVTKKLKGTNYYIELLTEEGVLNFFKYYLGFGKVKKNIIELKRTENFNYKLNRHFLLKIDEELSLLLKKSNIYLLPLLIGNNLVIYQLSINNKTLSNVEKKLCIDKEDDFKYILDFDIIKTQIGEENLYKLIEELLNNGDFQKKEILNCNLINDFIEYIDCLNDIKFKNLIYRLNINSNMSDISNKVNNLFNYYNTGINNKIIFDALDNLDEKLKCIVR